jgi:hypothetical protein
VQVDRSYRVKVCDFGLARVLSQPRSKAPAKGEPAAGRKGRQDPATTATAEEDCVRGAAVGTPQYGERNRNGQTVTAKPWCDWRGVLAVHQRLAVSQSVSAVDASPRHLTHALTLPLCG